MTYKRVQDDNDVINETEESEDFLNVIRLSSTNCKVSDVSTDENAFIISTNTESYM